MAKPFNTLRAAHHQIAVLEYERSHLLRACIAVIVSENRKRHAAKKRGEAFRRSRAGGLACKAVDVITGSVRP